MHINYSLAELGIMQQLLTLTNRKGRSEFCSIRIFLLIKSLPVNIIWYITKSLGA